MHNQSRLECMYRQLQTPVVIEETEGWLCKIVHKSLGHEGDVC